MQTLPVPVIGAGRVVTVIVVFVVQTGAKRIADIHNAAQYKPVTIPELQARQLR